jgi:hypothetical protein
MTEDHERYLADLRARHGAELEALRRALSGRHPGLLRDAMRRHTAVERETERILRAISRDGLAPAYDLHYPGLGGEGNDEKDFSNLSFLWLASRPIEPHSVFWLVESMRDLSSWPMGHHSHRLRDHRVHTLGTKKPSRRMSPESRVWRLT